MTALPIATIAGAGWCMEIPTGRRLNDRPSATIKDTDMTSLVRVWMAFIIKVEDQ